MPDRYPDLGSLIVLSSLMHMADWDGCTNPRMVTLINCSEEDLTPTEVKACVLTDSKQELVGAHES